MISKSLESAQRKVEGHNFDIRKHLVEYDDVMNKQRSYIYNKRYEAMTGESLRDECLKIFEDEISNLTNSYISADTGELMHEDLERTVNGILAPEAHLETSLKGKLPEEGRELIYKTFISTYDAKEQRISSEMMRIAEKALFLRAIDMLWIDHLDAMTHLREGIGLRGYGQKDPLVEYKNESFLMFKTLLAAIDAEIMNLIFKVEITPQLPGEQETRLTQAAKKATPQANEAKNRAQKTVVNKEKIGRNDPCWCGSGKKYKKCHGK
jgi:preprotein translocase subunit SecA